MGILNRLFGTPLPTDPLERAMLAHATGAGSEAWVNRELLGANVFVMLKGDAPAMSQGAPVQPLAVSTPLGHSVVCAFTSPERAVAMQHAHPDYRGGIAVDFAWVLATLPPGHGIVINPGHEAFLYRTPEDLERLKDDWQKAA